MEFMPVLIISFHLNDIINRLNLNVVNSLYDGNHVTHYDRSSKTNRCLDYIISNKKEFYWTEVNIDHELKHSPYRVLSEKGTFVRKHTDHVNVSGVVRLWRDPNNQEKPKMIKRFIKDRDSRELFKEATSFFMIREFDKEF